MISTRGYAVQNSKSPLAPFNFERRELKPNDILIEILFSGICHSDIHQARDEWGGGGIYPMVPGHEIAGKVTKVGSAVSKFKVGDLAGIGCLVDSCRSCVECKADLEQFCEVGMVGTYNARERDGKTPTYGGYSNQIVVDEKFSLKLPTNIELSRVAPLLCAGITTFSPLHYVGVKKGQSVAVMGLGGLGHMGVKFAAAMGAEVTVLSTSESKREDAKKLGAHHFVVTKDGSFLEKNAGKFDVILNTISAKIDLGAYVNLLKRDGTMILVGVPAAENPFVFHPFPLIMKRRKVMGSLIGGIKETQEMLDFCAKHEIGSEVEVIEPKQINEAYERMLKGDVKYRFVIDASKF